jgi:hypothetical protein
MVGALPQIGVVPLDPKDDAIVPTAIRANADFSLPAIATCSRSERTRDSNRHTTPVPRFAPADTRELRSIADETNQ